MPIDLLMALAIFLWFTGRSPVSFECLIRPIDVMNSAMMEKFCKLGQRSSGNIKGQPSRARLSRLGAIHLAV